MRERNAELTEATLDDAKDSKIAARQHAHSGAL
jgi:hypothetical protein